MPRSTDISRLVEQAGAGDAGAASKLMPLVYDELRRLAARYLRRERAGQTIQATALVHEAYLRLLKDKTPRWQGRTHFLAIAALSMRRILVERARARAASKRGGGNVRATFHDEVAAGREVPVDVLALDEAMTRLAAIDPQKARIVELRFFGGLTLEETADAVGTSLATVKREWTMARAWLKRELTGGVRARRARSSPPRGEEGGAPGS